jgi:hypothetical protein
MRKLKSLALSLGAVLLLVAAPSSFVAANQSNPQADGPDAKAQLGLTAEQVTDCRRQSAANSAGQDIFLSTATPKTYLNASGAWQNVDCAGTTFRLKTGERALIVSDFNAESDCNGTTPTNGQWCQTRALLAQVAPVAGAFIEGTPVAAESSSFAFDSVAGGSQNWQAHSMNRAWEVRCANTNGCQYRLVVQTRMHNSTVTGMWLDEIANHVRITSGAPAPL